MSITSIQTITASHFENSDGKTLLQKYIPTSKELPELWDVPSDSYMKKDEKNAAYEQLLIVVYMQHSSQPSQAL